MIIDGRTIETNTTFGVVNPSTGEVFEQAPECSQGQLNEAVAAAKRAFPKWAATPLAQRRKLMIAAAAKLKEPANEAKLRALLVKEQGKPVFMAQNELDGIQGYLLHFAQREYNLEKVLKDTAEESVIEKRVPLGVVGGITPWNFPPLMAAWKIAEALMTGNTFVLKPSPYTPLTSLLLGEMLMDVFPPGVINVVSGQDKVGQWLTEHPDVAKISFTGSTRTGKKIQAATSGTLKRLTLELGGNDAAVVLDDADIKEVAPKIFQNAMINTGQVCIAVKRCYVHESKYPEFVSAVTEAAKAAQKQVGDGFKEGVVFGPINNKMQFERVKELVEDAKKAGATINAGGAALPGKGYFYPPTIVTGVKEGVRIVDEEQFGPVLPVIPFKDTDDVIQRVNGTPYGLGGSVWTQDMKRGAEIASRIESGTVWVNQHMNLQPDTPFGGAKQSGVGRQMGEGTIEAYTDCRIIRILKPSGGKAKL